MGKAFRLISLFSRLHDRLTQVLSPKSKIESFSFRRQEAVIERIFDPKAMQCKNCGVRYSPNDQRAYEQHLNWHFRMNKKNKENARRAQSRKW